MHHTKVILFLKTLSSKEITRFEKYVNSPYFNTHEDTKRLFRTIKKYYPDFSASKLAKEKVFARLFPGQQFDESKIYTLNKYLFKLLVDFLLDQDRQQEELKNTIVCSIFFWTGSLTALFPSKLMKPKKPFNSTPTVLQIITLKSSSSGNLWLRFR